jgi:transposase
MDNARVHNARDSEDAIAAILQAAGVKLIFFFFFFFWPEYSPKLNPCELVFAKVKHLLRWYRRSFSRLWVEILQALAHVTFEDLRQFYKQCTQMLLKEDK